MKIAYLCNYIGEEFRSRYCVGKKYALSGILKSQGVARALLNCGHEVTIFSPGLTVADCYINQFEEVEHYPEGDLHVIYSKCFSYRRCSPINEILTSLLLKRAAKYFDTFIYYNISLVACLSIRNFRHAVKLLEYEDNVFNKALEGDKNNRVLYKKFLYKYIIERTDGVISVCLGLMLKDVLNYSVLVPGIVNEEVIHNISNRVNVLDKNRPVHIVLTGGIHYSKGGDLLVGAMDYIKTPCIVSVYGNCELDTNLKQLVKKVPERHKFIFHGYMPHEELVKTLNAEADILINTTRSMGVGAQSAGFPFKIMEYASVGRPIVSSEIGKLDEDFNKHITYYEEETPASIGAAIEEVISNYDEKEILALNLQKRVLAEYTIEGTGLKLDRFLREIIEEKKQDDRKL